MADVVRGVVALFALDVAVSVGIVAAGSRFARQGGFRIEFDLVAFDFGRVGGFARFGLASFVAPASSPATSTAPSAAPRIISAAALVVARGALAGGARLVFAAVGVVEAFTLR
jgi:hypothetical protein